MKHFIGFVLAALLATAPAFAQSPKGWKLRSDHSSDASDPDAPGANKFSSADPVFTPSIPWRRSTGTRPTRPPAITRSKAHSS